MASTRIECSGNGTVNGLSCCECGRRLCVVFMGSIGTTHQWIAGAQCLECAERNEIDAVREWASARENPPPRG